MSRGLGAVGTQFTRFCVVGAVGFVVDAGLLVLLLETTALGPYLARVLSFLVAALVTWRLHRVYTFARAARDHQGRQGGLFVAVNAAGAGVNYGVYAALIAGSALFARHPVAAVAAGSAVALVVNFLANRHLVFRGAAG
jgi:putative flippase GtrA